MTEQEQVEMETVTIQVPKRLMRVVKALNYFNSTKTEFFSDALKSWVSCKVHDMDFEDSEKIEQKYPWLDEATVTH